MSFGHRLRFALALSLCSPLAANAHIQWFADVDVTGDPLAPWDVMATPSFVALALLAAAMLHAAGWIDARLSQAEATARFVAWRSFDAGSSAATAMRWGIAASFIASIIFFRATPIFLTPELKAPSMWIVILQGTIALAALANRPRVAAAGIALLFMLAAASYGVFHLLDYPLFLGIAYFLATQGPDATGRMRSGGVLRAAVVLTLMWGAVEKWLYPQWTYPLLCGSGKALLMGLAPDFFMQCAGYVEFGLTFVVLVGGVAGRIACGLLIGAFLAAIPMFGALDAVGHAPFLLALGVLATLRNPLAARFGRAHASMRGLCWSGVFLAMLGGLPMVYFAAHQLAYGRLRIAHVSGRSIAELAPLALAPGLIALATLVRRAARDRLRARSPA